MSDLYKKKTPEMRALTKEYTEITVAHCGGRSTEIVKIVDGEIQKTDVFRYGIHTPEDAGSNAAREALDDQLKEKWPEGEGSLLAVGGGVWRAVGKLVCAEGNLSLSRRDAERELSHLARQDLDYFEERCDKRRAPYMATAAQSLLQLIQHTDAEKVVFLTGKIVSVLTNSLLEKNANSSPHEVKTTFLPFNPITTSPCLSASATVPNNSRRQP